MMNLTPTRHAPSKADEMPDTTANAPRFNLAEQSSGSGAACEVMDSATPIAPGIAQSPIEVSSASAGSAFDLWWLVSGESLVKRGFGLQELMEAAYCAAEAKKVQTVASASHITPAPSVGHFAGESDADTDALVYRDLATGERCELIGHALGHGSREADAVLVYRNLEDGGLHYMLPEEFEATKVFSLSCIQLLQGV